MGVFIKFVIFDGNGFWLDYKLYFEVCVEMKGWLER